MLYNLLSAKACINYILETEEEDFKLNPSDNHVYYHAIVALFGENAAKNELEEALQHLTLEVL